MYVKDKPKTTAQRQKNKEIRQAAEAIRSKIQMDLYTGDFKLNGDNKAPKDFLAYFNQFVETYKDRNRNTYNNWRSAYNHLFHFTKGQLMTNKLTSAFAEKYKEYLLSAQTLGHNRSRPLAQNSKYLYFNRFCQIVRKAYNEGLLKENPVTNIRPIKKIETERQYLTIEELQALADTDFYDKDFKTVCLFAAYCGLRHSDLKNLKWSNIIFDTEVNQYIIQYRQQKTKNVEKLPVSEKVIERLGTFKNTDELIFPNLQESSNCNKKLMRWTKDAGIKKHITFHCFRHTYATLLLHNKVDIYTVSKLLGHRSIKTTQVYAKLTDQSKMEAIKALPNLN